MSLALGQNPSYINRIENGKALPSMQGFFSICEYLQITPGDFFNEDSEVPREVRELLEKIECKLCLNGMPVPLLRNCYSIFNGTKYR